jgi:hypothetical protein
MKRFFAFGCSLTRYAYATWADLAAANFDEYYNYAKGGGSNTLMMGRLIEADNYFDFNKDTDTVYVMLSGIGRYSYYTYDRGWITNGDLYSYLSKNNNKDMEFLVKNIYNDKGAIYQSWLAAHLMKKLLVSKGIPHKILYGINNSNYLVQNEFNDEESIRKVMDIESIVDIKTPFNDWFRCPENLRAGPVTPNYTDANTFDGHPSQLLHYKFLKNFLPEFDTEITNKLFTYVESIFDGRSQHKQETTYRNKFYKKFNRAFTHPLFGQEHELW